jgi:hypothetical protein
MEGFFFFVSFAAPSSPPLLFFLIPPLFALFLSSLPPFLILFAPHLPPSLPSVPPLHSFSLLLLFLPSFLPSLSSSLPLSEVPFPPFLLSDLLLTSFPSYLSSSSLCPSLSFLSSSFSSLLTLLFAASLSFFPSSLPHSLDLEENGPALRTNTESSLQAAEVLCSLHLWSAADSELSRLELMDDCLLPGQGKAEGMSPGGIRAPDTGMGALERS